MIEGNVKKRPLVVCISCSILVHLVGASVVGQARVFQFATPLAMRPSVTVNLIEANEGTRREEMRKSFALEPTGPVASNGSSAGDPETAGPQIGLEEPALPTPSASVPGSEVQAEMTGPVPGNAAPQQNSPSTEVPMQGGQMTMATHAAKLQLKAPLRKGSEFLVAARESLTYRIVMFGITVGEAVIEATNNATGFTVTTRVTSNAAISTLYPVDDFVETKLVCGNYLVTRISQHEGSYTRSTGFTIMLRERKAFSVERLRAGFVTDPLPRDDVLDVLSGFYFLRNQPVEVGKSLLLHLYDGKEYAPTVVEVLRKETVHVPSLGEVETLVIHPVLAASGYFQRTGEMLVWLTADEYKVPVRMQTTIVLGPVMAELVSAEVER